MSNNIPETITHIENDKAYEYKLENTSLLSKEQLTEQYGKLQYGSDSVVDFISNQMYNFFEANTYFASFKDHYKDNLRDWIGESVEADVEDDLKQLAEGIDLSSRSLRHATAETYGLENDNVTPEQILKEAVMLRIDSWIYGGNR